MKSRKQVIQNCGRESGMRISAQGILDIVGSKGILKKRNIADNSMEKELVNYISTLEKPQIICPGKKWINFLMNL